MDDPTLRDYDDHDDDGDDDGAFVAVLKANECVGDFWITLRKALVEAGGDPDLADFGADMQLKMFAECIAPNGIRMVYRKEASMGENRQMPSD